MAIAVGMTATPWTDAAVIITGLHGTGLNYSATTATQDAHWNIAALPASGTGGALGAAWIPTGGGGSTNIPGGWLGGNGNAGANGNRWLSVQANNTSSLIASGVTNDYYSTIFSTTFTASAAGTVWLSFDIAADNRATVFLGGSITGTGTDRPTITGGQQVGNQIWNVGATVANPDTFPRAFSLQQTAAGFVNVVAGTNTLYVVVDDYISVPGATTFGSIGLLLTVNPAAVPGSGLAAIGMLGLAGAGRRRRR